MLPPQPVEVLKLSRADFETGFMFELPREFHLEEQYVPLAKEQPGEADSEAAPDVGGYVELSYDGEEEEHELVIAPLGASVDGGPVKSFDPLGFLA